MLNYAPRHALNFYPITLSLLLAFWLGLMCWTGPASAFPFKDYGPHPKMTPPDAILARAVQLKDAQTGEILFARNPDERLLPASTTKLMTALIVYEKLGGLKGSCTVVDDDRAEPSNIPRRAGRDDLGQHAFPRAADRIGQRFRAGAGPLSGWDRRGVCGHDEPARAFAGAFQHALP